MHFRSRLRRGISLEVIFEEEYLRPGQSGTAEVRQRSRSPEQLLYRAPSLMTLTETDDAEYGSGCWEEDDFSRGAAGISRRQILGLTHLYGTSSDPAPPLPPPPGAAGGDAATRRWVAAHSARRRPRTVGDLRSRHRGTDFLGQYRLADLLVNDNIVIVDTSPPSDATSDTTSDVTSDGSERSEEPSQDGAERAEGGSNGEMPPPQTVRRVADRFEQLARREPDSYVLWRDTARLSGIRANPSSKILRSDTGADTDDCHRLFQRELHELFRARRAAAGRGDAGSGVDSGADAGSDSATSDGTDHVDNSAADDSDSDSDSLFSSDSDGDGVRPIAADALARIRRQGVSVTYHGPRGGARGRPSLGQLVAEARRQPAYVAVTAPRVVGALPKRGSHTLPSKRTSTTTTAGGGAGVSTGLTGPAAVVAEVKSATLRPRRPPTPAAGWRQTGRCYVYDFSHSRSHRPPPLQLKPRPAHV